jgi:hypothetical protein
MGGSEAFGLGQRGENRVLGKEEQVECHDRRVAVPIAHSVPIPSEAESRLNNELLPAVPNQMRWHGTILA